MKRNLLLGWISLFGVLAFAQEDPVVMRINGKDIPRSEFEYSYRRHADGNGMKLSPKEYAEFFIQSKLKVEAARAAGLDTTSVSYTHLDVYKRQEYGGFLCKVSDTCLRPFVYWKLGYLKVVEKDSSFIRSNQSYGHIE